jgi:hypothetical protein
VQHDHQVVRRIAFAENNRAAGVCRAFSLNHQSLEIVLRKRAEDITFG